MISKYKIIHVDDYKRLLEEHQNPTKLKIDEAPVSKYVEIENTALQSILRSNNEKSKKSTVAAKIENKSSMDSLPPPPVIPNPSPSTPPSTPPSSVLSATTTPVFSTPETNNEILSETMETPKSINKFDLSNLPTKAKLLMEFFIEKGVKLYNDDQCKIGSTFISRERFESYVKKLVDGRSKIDNNFCPKLIQFMVENECPESLLAPKAEKGTIARPADSRRYSVTSSCLANEAPLGLTLPTRSN